MSQSMPVESEDVRTLFERIAALVDQRASLNAVVFRSATMKYASEKDFLSGSGAAAVGGRWNRRGIKSVYASLDPHTAVDEAWQEFQLFGFPDSAIRPRVFVGAKVVLTWLLDLTDGAIRRRIGFRLKDLIEEDWRAIQDQGDEAWTQAIGRGSREAGFEGLIVPSARNRIGRNLVVFPNCLRPHSQYNLLGAKDLPKHPAPGN